MTFVDPASIRTSVSEKDSFHGSRGISSQCLERVSKPDPGMDWFATNFPLFLSQSFSSSTPLQIARRPPGSIPSFTGLLRLNPLKPVTFKDPRTVEHSSPGETGKATQRPAHRPAGVFQFLRTVTALTWRTHRAGRFSPGTMMRKGPSRGGSDWPSLVSAKRMT